jgi:hypothetical protein
MNCFSRLIRRPNFKAGLFSCLALLLCEMQPAGATVISASVSIDWSSFKITPIDMGNGLPTLTWNSQKDISSALIMPPYDFSSYADEEAPNWSAGTSAIMESGSSSAFNYSASASTSVNQLKADASVGGSVVNLYTGTESYSARSGGFTVEGNGLLLFQANYSLVGEVGAGAKGSPLLDSRVGFYLSASNEGYDFLGSSGASHEFAVNRTFGSYSENGYLAVALPFKDGWSGNFTTVASAKAYSSYSVPLPAAFWLFGSALAGVAALRRSS